MPEIEIYDTEAAIAEQKRQAAAERSRRYRQAKREEGKPDANATDSALAEAVSFLASVAIPEPKADTPAGEPIKWTVRIDLEDLHRVAVTALVREGARRSYARQAVSARIQKRALHDAGHVMPSRSLSPHDAIIEQPPATRWLASEVAFVRSLVARWRKAVQDAS